MSHEQSERGQSNTAAKEAAGRAAAQLVENGMIVGLGTGSTARFLLIALAERIHTENLAFRGVPTSRRARDHAQELGIPLVKLTPATRPDLTIDGADEIDPSLNVIKGGGGALVQEKIVAASSRRMIVIGDASKQVATMGAFPLPIAVIPFGHETTLERIVSRYSVPVNLRRGDDGAIFVTDDGLYIADAHMGGIEDPAELLKDLNGVAGVAECGLFVGLASGAIIGHDDGSVTRL